MIWISILHHALGPLLLMYSSCILDRNFKFKMIHIDIKFTLEISIYKTIQQLVISREMPQILIYSHRESNKCEQYFILNRTWFLLDHESSLWKDPPRACYELGLSLYRLEANEKCNYFGLSCIHPKWLWNFVPCIMLIHIFPSTCSVLSV
jgi:hypothetical protein